MSLWFQFRHSRRLLRKLFLLVVIVATLPAATEKERLLELNAKAKAGDAEAQYRLGQAYSFNTTVTLIDPVQADFWFAKAAAQNHLGAILSQINLHTAYPRLSVSDADTALLLARAADMGHMGSSVRLGMLLWDGGRNLKADRTAAYQRLRDGALRGSETAALFLASHAKNGDGVQRDPAAARAILQWAAKRGSIIAAMHLHVMDDKDRGLEKIRLVARQLEKMAKKGDARAHTLLGQAYENGVAIDSSEAAETLAGRFTRARECYENATDLGDAEAKALLGSLYARGLGGTANLAQARRCFEESAAAGHPLGQFNLGMLMLTGATPEAEPARIIALLEAAARTHTGACFTLGMMYYQGDRVIKNPAQAVTFFERAARNGHAAACVNLGVIAANGEIRPADLTIAAKWWTMAALAGSEDGAKLLAQISDRISAPDRERILQELHNWKSDILRESVAGWTDLELIK